MFRALLRLVVVLVVLVGVGAFFLGWWGSGRGPASRTGRRSAPPGAIDTEKAKEVGAEVAAKTAEAANKAGELLTDGALTAKIKSKMALDDLVKARTIDVTTSDHVVTLRGTRGIRGRARSRRAAGEGDGGRDSGGRQAGGIAATG